MNPASKGRSDHVSAFELDLFELGALDGARLEALSQHLATCLQCRRERAALRAHKAEFSEAMERRLLSFPLPPEETKPRRPTRRAYLLAAPLLLAAASLLLVANWQGVRPGGGAANIEIKGEGDLSVVARRDGRVIPLDRFNRTVSPGDEIRFAIVATDPTRLFLLVASVDGAGHANVYYPFGGSQSVRLDHAGRWEIPGSIVLDETLGSETIFAFLSQEPLEASRVSAALTRVAAQGPNAIRATDHIDLGAGSNVEQKTFRIEKAARGGLP